ncbi:MAG: cysteine desulfurase family protein [Gammaproteobacteria bacterium]|jgi:cysteine desulfurase
MSRIYLDYNASTPLAPEVATVMRRLMDEAYGNPSSTHWAGAPAREAIDTARRQVADLLGCLPDEIVFTSGGSEANNLALKGTFYSRRRSSFHLITTAVEHPAILAPCAFLEAQGARVTLLPVDRHGLVDPDDLEGAIREDTGLVSIMHANNEVGTIEPIEECSRIAREHGVPFHSDAAQSVGKIPTRVDELGVDMLSLAGHKFYAPKGVGALYIRRGIDLEPLIHGAGHETGRRAGTESALLVGALGAASELARDLSGTDSIQALRDLLWHEIQEAFGDAVALNGHPDRRLPNTLNVSFIGRRGSEILAAMQGVAASTGSACHADRVELSPVLKAMGVQPNAGMGSIRFSLGRPTTEDEIDRLMENLTA